ncbi:hypothetical protein AcV5_002647 [Taiwanofungus camphoratus]|nr:hypothetical protein AcV5_002647 [Antrodia cinnamomea]KAI0918847.1 hypothetical protein AcV7_006961 [Antrodia cinnamomea]
MKFARYLEETQTPEWKKAYIDYRGLKKHVTAIRRAQEAADGSTPPLPLMPYASAGAIDVDAQHTESASPGSPHGSLSIESTLPLPPPAAYPGLSDIRDGTSSNGPMPFPQDAGSEYESNRRDGQIDSPLPPSALAHSTNTALHTGILPRLRRRSTALSALLRSRPSRTRQEPPSPAPVHIHSQSEHHRDTNELAQRHAPWAAGTNPPLMELLPLLTPMQRAFFEKLDVELDKVESFFCAREREVRARYEALKEQLQELKDHRRVFYEAHPQALKQRTWIPLPFPLTLAIRRLRRHVVAAKPTVSPVRPGKRREPCPGEEAAEKRIKGESLDRVGETSAGDGPNSSIEKDTRENGVFIQNGDTRQEKSVSRERQPRPRLHSRQRVQLQINGDATEHVEDVQSPNNSGDGVGGVAPKHDPEEYQQAKKQLKKAALECYRGLEVLNNYRTLNLIGFRKALKKFEKFTHIPAQHAYTIEKIEPSACASGAGLEAMLRDMEDLFAARFTRGDKKRAMARLRGGAQQKSHHFSTFRSGMMLGFAIPAFVDGLYQSFQPETRAEITGWDGLLFVYAIMLVPVVFSFLVGLNVLVWHNARINYVFIFELDVRSSLDHREYFEIPALLLFTLSYAFWFSFARIGAHSLSPTVWPLLWLAWTGLVILNPLPVLFKSTRWWLLRNIGRLLTSGTHRVEFADFWMGDQFCSLVFTLSNLYFVGCAYANGLEHWRQCTTGRNWGPAFALAALPLLVRFVQSIKRWVDSSLITHLINAGKYGSGIIYYLVYYLWRAHGGGRGGRFVTWCVFGTLYSLYASSWDFLMDWSVLRPHVRHPMLRSELLYSNRLPLYYLAIVTNVLIRFIWVFYIPESGPNYVIKTFVAAMLEMLRRWQWNFFRLENEHLGNMDQYRVTREVPLPYSFDDPSYDSDGGDEDEEHDGTSSSSTSWRRRKSHTPSREAMEDADGS